MAVFLILRKEKKMNVNELQEKILELSHDEATPDTALREKALGWLNNAYNELMDEVMPYLQDNLVQEQVVTTNSEGNVTLTHSVKKVVRMVDTTNGRTMGQVSTVELLDMDSSMEQTGVPVRYTLSGNIVQVHPVEQVELRAVYLPEIAELEASGDENSILLPKAYHHALVWGGLVWGSMYERSFSAQGDLTIFQKKWEEAKRRIKLSLSAQPNKTLRTEPFVSSTQFSIESDAFYYGVGSSVKARLGTGVYVTSTVASVTGEGTITVTLDDAVLTSALDEVAFTVKPPPFNYIYPAHDRLWGFGQGSLKVDGFGASVDRSRVYYTDGLNDECGWYDEEGVLPSINIADKMPVLDELMAMAVKDGMTVFFCKNYTQIWTGVDPTVSGDLAWLKTLPVGVVHGNLVVDMPNDVGFFTRYGARTLSRMLQTEQLDVGDFGSEVDPTLGNIVSQMLVDDGVYRQAESFNYSGQGWFGFKPADKSVIFQVSGNGNAWTVFEGIFASANAFLNTPDGKLYMAKEGQLYHYDEAVWSDAGEAIVTRWWTPWLNVGTNFKRWANKVLRVVTEQGAAIPLTLKRYKNYNSSSYVQQEVMANTAADYWEDANWDEAFWDNGAPEPEPKRDHFVADVFSYAVESESTQGPLTIFGIKIKGVYER